MLVPFQVREGHASDEAPVLPPPFDGSVLLEVAPSDGLPNGAGAPTRTAAFLLQNHVGNGSPSVELDPKEPAQAGEVDQKVRGGCQQFRFSGAGSALEAGCIAEMVRARGHAVGEVLVHGAAGEVWVTAAPVGAEG